MKRIFLISILAFLIVFSSLLVFTNQRNFETKRELLLNQLFSNIEDAKEIGRYDCCIEPPCTMCYLGNWIWEDGSCYCDDMIKNKEFDKVCPQCKKGIEEGRCTSTDGGVCEI